MINYDLAAEYSALIIVLAVLISFTRDYETKTLSYKCLKGIYYVVFLTVIATITTILCGVPGEGTLHIALIYITNVIYFVMISSISLCYLLYAVILTSFKFDERLPIKRIFFPYCIPYTIYLLLLFTNISNGKVFYVTETEGYVRGAWFQLPYVIAVINIVWVLAILVKNIKLLHRETVKVMILTALLGMSVLFIQFLNPNLIMTGVLNTMSILSIHLYVQNVRKSVDQLTGVYNRTALMNKLGAQIHRNEDVSMYIFSLRGFKMINERLGLAYGDKILIRIASYMMNLLPYESIYRYNGDEFAVILTKDDEKNEELIDNIVKFLEEPFVMNENKVAMEIVYARVDNKIFGNTVKELISAAEYSISMLKESNGELKYLHDTIVVKKMIEQSHMIEQIKNAIANDLFEVHYQPIYSANSKQYTQAEALVRMRDEEGKLIFPGDFIDLAERTGLVVQMTYLVLEHVCADMRKAIDNDTGNGTLEAISVNFPYLQFTEIDMEANVMKILQKYNIEPKKIKIEITERSLIEDAKMVKNAMLQMQRLGFEFELDDFGVEYSNMHTFLNLPINVIKLDRKILLATYEDEKKREFFKYLITGIKATNRTTIVEGVEEIEQLEFVIEAGCEHVQGYYFSKPLPFDKFQEFLA